MFYVITSLLFYALATAFCVWYGVALIDFCMDYANPFWKARYWAASRAAKRPYKLKKWLATARSAPLEAKDTIMAEAYKEIAAETPSFKRWICVYCLSTFVGIFIAGLAAYLLSGAYGWWTVLYWFSVFPFIGYLGNRE